MLNGEVSIRGLVVRERERVTEVIRKRGWDIRTPSETRLVGVEGGHDVKSVQCLGGETSEHKLCS